MKAFTFFGADLAKLEPTFLQGAYQQGYSLIPLDGSGGELAARAGLPFILGDAWLGAATIVNARVEAKLCEDNWATAGGNNLFFNNLNWPLFDREAMRWFWQNVTLAHAFAQKFLVDEYDEVLAITNDQLRPALYYYPADNHVALWQATLANRMRLVKLPLGNTSFLNLLPFDFASTNFDSSEILPRSLRGKIVIALNQAEFHRFSPVIRTLTQNFFNQVAAVLIAPNPTRATELTEQLKIPVISPHVSKANPTGLSEHFLEGYSKSKDNSHNTVWSKYLTRLTHHFEYYCQYRWPTLTLNYQAWLQLWTEARPELVIVSSLPDSESQLPAQAARQFGIPTISIPHGASDVLRGAEAVATDIVLCSSNLQRTIYQRGGVPNHKLKFSRNLVDINEYSPLSTGLISPKSTSKILAVTNPVVFPEQLSPYILLTEQLRALEMLTRLPKSLENLVSLKLKLHPGTPDLASISLAAPGLVDNLLPLQSDLQEVLTQTDLLVAVNIYSGSILVNALRAGIPVIFLWTDQTRLAKIEKIDPLFPELFFPAGIVVNSAEELWEVIRQFVADPKVAQGMRTTAQEFVKKFLDDTTFPDIAQVVSELAHLATGLHPQRLDQLIPEASSLPVNLVEYQYEYGGMPRHELETLCKIVRHKQPRKIFEIGTFLGATTLRLAANSQAEVYTLDLPPKGHPDYVAPLVIDPESDVYPAEPGARFKDTPYAARINQILANSQTFDYSPYYGQFDLVFVDACHHYEFVLRDSHTAFKLIKPDGIIIWHDYANYAPGVRQALSEINEQYPILHIEGTSLAVHFSSVELQEQAPDERATQPIQLSVIIPTCNRGEQLTVALTSILQQSLPASQYEIILVDNNSTDQTRQIVEEINCAHHHRIRYVLEPVPGLLSGRHRGALEAKGEILVFCDDDIEATSDWLAAIIQTFEHPDVHLVGGPSLPNFEIQPPDWIWPYCHLQEGHLTCGTLSLLDLGDRAIEIDPIQVWGLNYAIRKKTLFELGGFHPDNIPAQLQHFQGDGETGLSRKIKQRGYKAVYHPKAKVYHQIPAARLTVDYFEKWFFYYGVCDSYTAIRNQGKLEEGRELIFNPTRPHIPKPAPFTEADIRIGKAYADGYNFHLNAVRQWPELLSWVLKDNYFDYNLPQLGASSPESQTSRSAPVFQQPSPVQPATGTHRIFFVDQPPAPWTPPYHAYRQQVTAQILADQTVQNLFQHSDQLPPNYGRGLDERCIEYPWFFAVANPAAIEYLDAGSTLNHEFAVRHPYWSGKRLTITTLAPGAISFKAPWISYRYGDLRQTDFSDSSFDEIACLSTLEHIGMDNTLFTEDISKCEAKINDFVLALSEMRRILKPRGRLLLTVPFGKYQNWGEFQQFDKVLLDRAANAFGAVSRYERYYRYTPQGWRLANSAAECADLEYAASAVKMRWGAKGTPAQLEPDGAAAARAVACCIWHRDH